MSVVVVASLIHGFMIFFGASYILRRAKRNREVIKINLSNDCLVYIQVLMHW